METICAWCLKERGEQPCEEDSHGICKTHAAQLNAEYEQIAQERRAKRERRAAACTR